MRARRTKVEAGQSDSRQGTGRLALLRLVAAIFVAFTLSFMPMAMSSGPAMAHTTPVVLSDTRHCIGEHGTSPDRQMGGMVDCAIACAAVRPTEPQMATGMGHVRQILESQPVPLLKGIGPDALSRPPRLFPEA